MKNIFFILFFCFFSCVTKEKIIGTFVLDLRNNTSYNCVLKVKKDHCYSIETKSTGSSGITIGKWKLKGRMLVLFPDQPIYTEEKIGDSIYNMTEFSPFPDTLKFRLKNKCLVRLNVPYKFRLCKSDHEFNSVNF